MKKITSALIEELIGLKSLNINVDGLGVADTKYYPELLTFLDNKNFIQKLNENSNVSAAFVMLEDAPCLREGIKPIVVDDPKWYFFSLLSALGRTKVRAPSIISESAEIHPSAQISAIGVTIENGVVIEAGVVVMPGVMILEGATIRAGAVLGVDGFEHKRTSKGILSVVHDGEVVVGRRAEVGPNNTVIKGFGYRPTIIGEETKLDALVHYAHGVQSGSRCLIAASAMIAGHVTIGNDVWIGPSASISNRINIGDGAFVSLGSVVVTDVMATEKVTGNFAIPHKTFIRNFIKTVRK